MENEQPTYPQVATPHDAPTDFLGDGKPLKPPGKASSAPANGAAMPPWARIKTIEESLGKHPGNNESVYSSGKHQDKADFKALKIKLRELKAEQEAEAIA